MVQSNEEVDASSMLPRLSGMKQRLGLLSEVGPGVRARSFFQRGWRLENLNFSEAGRYFWGTTYTTVSQP